ncbi:MAG TPA: hypothetical protein VFW11_22025 [Cyclobacteriaceae bacterium]|nr:hypothetical protein [Cyclobacteriaceae bacterium]
MNPPNRILVLCSLSCLISIPCFSQESNSTTQKNDPSSRTAGLRKIASGSHRMDLEINIDDKAIEESVESAVGEAMASVETALEQMEIHIEPIEINLGDMDMNLDPVVINIPALDIDIEPVDIDLDDIDIDIDVDEDHFHWKNDAAQFLDKDKDKDKVKEKNKDKEKDKVKDKSDKENNEKAKGLKKIN